ncbi:MAG: hypothetical protein AB7E09_00070 [Candidatus Izemoplasmatales bacterium]
MGSIVFENTFSLSDIIGFVIGFIGVILTIITISIIRKQRNDLHTPFIVIHVNNPNTSEYILVRSERTKVNDSILDEWYYHRNMPKICIENHGNSIGTEIIVTIHCLSDLMVKNPTIKNENGLESIGLIAAHGYKDIIFPYSSLKVGDSEMITHQIVESIQENGKLMYHYSLTDEYIKNPTKSIQHTDYSIKVEYKNILNKKYEKKYKIRLIFTSITSTKIAYKINILNDK